MKKFIKTSWKYLAAFLAIAVCAAFHTESFADGFDLVGRISSTECLTLDTVKSYVPNLSQAGSGLAMAAAAMKLTDGENEFEVKSKEDIEKLEELELEKYYESLTEFQNKNIMYLQEQLKDSKDEQKRELEKQVLELVKSANETLHQRVKDLGRMVANQEKELKATQGNGERELIKEIKENSDKLKAIKDGSTTELVELKALTNRAAIGDNDQAVELPEIGQLATRRLSMMEMFTTIPVTSSNHNGTIRYYDWDEATTARSAAMIAEGATFPESTAKWQKYTIDLKKVGDTLPVTEEFFEDEQMFANELEMFLMTNMDLAIDNQICNGDGTGQNLTGLFASTPAFNSALVGTAPNATFYDLLALAQEQISKTGGAKYIPDFVVMNITSINRMRLTKDANQNYIIPPFVAPNGRVVDGLIVVESNVVPDNQLVLGDRRFARIYEMAGMTIARGTTGTQFVEDEITLKVRKRLLFLIRNVDKTGFVKVTDITAAITAIDAP